MDGTTPGKDGLYQDVKGHVSRWRKTEDDTWEKVDESQSASLEEKESEPKEETIQDENQIDEKFDLKVQTEPLNEVEVNEGIELQIQNPKETDNIAFDQKSTTDEKK